MAKSHPRIEAARAGVDPACICRVPSGWVFLCDMQFLRGYCILQADPVVASINALDPAGRANFLADMVNVGDALLALTGAYRINYILAGNRDPVLHAHIVPRYLSEPDDLRQGGIHWSHLNAYDNSARFDAVRDKILIDQLAVEIRNRR
jgi:diadenosine tetraphosphate (Ap4A) HIT family hydrolase